MKTPTRKVNARQNKYRAKAVVIDGIRFDSMKEGKRYSELKLEERAGEISGLEVKPKYRIEINGILICRYIPDFRYIRNGTVVVEDVKGYKTDVYKLKKKMVEAAYGVTVTET